MKRFISSGCFARLTSPFKEYQSVFFSNSHILASQNWSKISLLRCKLYNIFRKMYNNFHMKGNQLCILNSWNQLTEYILG
jgi:hypothetical protein